MGKLFKESRDVVRLENDDFEELKQRVFSFYGSPTVAIEITDEVFQMIITKAAMQLNTYSPKIDNILKSVFSKQNNYTIYEYEQINSVLDVYVSTEYLIGLGLPIPALLGSPMSFASTHNSMHLDNFVSMFASYDMAKRMFGTHPNAELIHPNIIELSPRPYMDSVFNFVITVCHDEDLGSLNDYETNWFVRYCTALTGKMVGQIRRKYDGVTLPVGTLSTTGNSIFTESVELEKSLIEEIKSRKKFPQAFITVG